MGKHAIFRSPLAVTDRDARLFEQIDDRGAAGEQILRRQAAEHPGLA
jgi:hypothetical protein